MYLPSLKDIKLIHVCMQTHSQRFIGTHGMGTAVKSRFIMDSSEDKLRRCTQIHMERGDDKLSNEFQMHEGEKRCHITDM